MFGWSAGACGYQQQRDHREYAYAFPESMANKTIY